MPGAERQLARFSSPKQPGSRAGNRVFRVESWAIKPLTTARRYSRASRSSTGTPGALHRRLPARRPCPFRARCTKAKQEPRIIGLLPREQHEALQAARHRQETEEFRQQYAARAGIEGTHEQAVRRCGLRRCRYVGQSKAHLQHLLTAAAINVIRLDDWWAGAPVSRTRCSR